MRLILICITTLLLLIQYPLWLGKGGWLRVWELDQQVAAAHKKNDELKARNAKLDSEVQDLKQGTGAVEERARLELGMIKDNEIFIQVLDANTAPPPNQAALSPTPPPTPLPISPSHPLRQAPPLPKTSNTRN